PVACLIAVFLLLLGGLARDLTRDEKARQHIEFKAQEAADEMERNFARMADERVQQVTESERKRIASDLHDDLGAKLLTIVHTSQSERISNLAREALEEMRLSVRGLTGRPMLLMDALGDWRAELVMRLAQTGIEADWKHPLEETEQALSARVYVQTTRILRESVSNIIKHSEASLCTVTCEFDDHEFCITIQDNGRGILASPESKLDRGHGMASMKHRAKQIEGHCLVESAPGFGTVIRLTIPFESGIQSS
ncbi:MAG: sensor histidine kinase, partial [Burkholderiales bacterium]